jgi:hypothetical protein
MVHVFLLLVFVGSGEAQKLVSGDMYFWDVNKCNYFASKLVKRYGNYKYKYRLDKQHKSTAYCVPKYIEQNSVRIY